MSALGNGKPESQPPAKEDPQPDVSPILDQIVRLITTLFDAFQDLVLERNTLKLNDWKDQFTEFCTRLYQYVLTIIYPVYLLLFQRVEPIYKKVEPSLKPQIDWASEKLDSFKGITQDLTLPQIKETVTDAVKKLPSPRELTGRVKAGVTSLPEVVQNKVTGYISEEMKIQYTQYLSDIWEWFLSTAIILWVTSLFTQIKTHKMVIPLIGKFHGFLQLLRLEQVKAA